MERERHRELPKSAARRGRIPSARAIRASAARGGEHSAGPVALHPSESGYIQTRPDGHWLEASHGSPPAASGVVIGSKLPPSRGLLASSEALASEAEAPPLDGAGAAVVQAGSKAALASAIAVMNARAAVTGLGTCCLISRP